MKKSKILNVTKQNMREYGFSDGYSGRKTQEDVWIKKFLKRKLKTSLIKEHIESYRTGYKVGQYALHGLNNAKIKNGEVYYNNKIIDEKISDEALQQKVKSLKSNKNKKEGK